MDPDMADQPRIKFSDYITPIQTKCLVYLYGENYKTIKDAMHARKNRPLHSEPTVICLWKTILSSIEDEKDSLTTLQSILDLVDEVRSELHKIEMSLIPAYIAIDATCDLFKRFIVLVNPTISRSANLALDLIASGKRTLESLRGTRGKLLKYAKRFIKDGSKILIHGNSSCVIDCISSMQLGTIYLTTCSSSTGKFSESTNFGSKIRQKIGNLIEESNSKYNDYQKSSLDIKLIPDTAVAFYMNKVDFCLVGAEGVIENGGIINQIGTFQVALIAKQFNKPFYCTAESFKFMRMFPLSQDDLRNPQNSTSPLVDMTPPNLISLFLSDLGILTPGEVCDALIRLYNTD